MNRHPSKVSGVYYLYFGDVVIYVGQSTNIWSRVGDHIRDGKDFDSWEYREVDPSDLVAEERSEIDRLKPALNWQTKGRFKSSFPGHLKELRKLERKEHRNKQRYRERLRICRLEESALTA